jgi:hypothetical protein
MRAGVLIAKILIAKLTIVILKESEETGEIHTRLYR